MAALENILVEEFAPIHLTVDRIGPFQSRLEEFDFTDSEDEPCNLFLMVSKNGRGKTTVLELLVTMMNMLGQTELNEFGFEDLDHGSGRAQWDIRVKLNRDGRKETVLLSLLAGRLGEDTALRVWGEPDLKRIGANAWHRGGFRRLASGRMEAIGSSNEWIKDFTALIGYGIGERQQIFEGDPLTYPTLLYFSAYRDIIPVRDMERSITTPKGWGYYPVHNFAIEGRTWNESLDNLLIWLKWLDDGRFDKAINIVNQRVFHGSSTYLKGVRKDPPEAIIVTENHEYRLDRLSSGEKSLVQMFLRIGAHMTRNTLLLIDEVDVHLHTQWRYRLLYDLKKLAKEYYPGLTIIVTSHAYEIMKAFALELAEDNLHKGGHIIETPEEEAEAERIATKARSVRNGEPQE